MDCLPERLHLCLLEVNDDVSQLKKVVLIPGTEQYQHVAGLVEGARDRPLYMFNETATEELMVTDTIDLRPPAQQRYHPERYPCRVVYELASREKKMYVMFEPIRDPWTEERLRDALRVKFQESPYQVFFSGRCLHDGDQTPWIIIDKKFNVRTAIEVTQRDDIKILEFIGSEIIDFLRRQNGRRWARDSGTGILTEPLMHQLTLPDETAAVIIVGVRAVQKNWEFLVIWWYAALPGVIIATHMVCTTARQLAVCPSAVFDETITKAAEVIRGRPTDRGGGVWPAVMRKKFLVCAEK